MPIKNIRSDNEQSRTKLNPERTIKLNGKELINISSAASNARGNDAGVEQFASKNRLASELARSK